MTPARGMRIADGLVLPAEAVTETFGIYARRGSGKTYTAAVLAEELLRAGHQVVVVDPLNVWWGLRADASGRGPGLPITILGGDHGDLPLEPAQAGPLADAVAEERLPAVLSLRHLSKTQQRAFVGAFLERLYDRKGEAALQTPLHLILDEADLWAPQRLPAGQERLFGAVDDIVRRGRSSGFGATLITQRPAVLHNDVRTQVECLVALRLSSPHDRAAVDEWIKAHDAEGRRQEVLGSLASLAVGEAWFWSPGWLNLLKRVRVRQRQTFDSSATPKPGQPAHAPGRLAPVDLARLQERLAAAGAPPAARPGRAGGGGPPVRVERVEVPVPVEVPVEVPVLTAAQLGQLKAAVDQLGRLTEELGAALARVAGHAAPPGGAVPAPRAPAGPTPASVRSPRRRPAGPREGAPAGAPAGGASDGVRLKAGERAMLRALATLAPARLSRTQLGTLAGFAPGGGTFQRYLSTLRGAGLVDGSPDALGLTAAGRAVVGDHFPAAPQTTAELVALWAPRLKAGERRMLDVLVAAYPRGLSKDQLGARAGFEPAGGTFQRYLSTLRGIGLAENADGGLRAGGALFLGAGRPAAAPRTP